MNWQEKNEFEYKVELFWTITYMIVFWFGTAASIVLIGLAYGYNWNDLGQLNALFYLFTFFGLFMGAKIDFFVNLLTDMTMKIIKKLRRISK